MRKFLLVLVIVGVLVGGLAAYLILTTPKQSTGVRFPLAERDLSLMAKVPDSADAFALIPDAAAVHEELRENAVLRDLINEWTTTQRLPQPWMVGGGDLVIWRSGKQTTYAMDLDPVRAALVRVYVQLTGAPLLINTASSEPLGSEDVARIQSLARPLPPADILVVQRREGRGVFPPIGRPAITSIQIERDDVMITSRAIAKVEDRRPRLSGGEVAEDASVPPRRYTFPAAAMLSASFSSPPRVVEDLNRIFGARVSSLFSDGGAIAIFEVNSGTFLPSPKGVIILPGTDRHREALRGLGSVGGLLQSRDTGEELLVSFDEKSIDRYIQEPKVPSHWPSANWAIRADPEQLVPVLERAGDSMGLRIAAPRLYRAARDLRDWIGPLGSADLAEAASVVEGGSEELRVRIASR